MNTTPPTDKPRGESTPPSQRLAELILSMNFVTEKGLRARQLARETLDSEAGLLHSMRLIEHATAPTHDDGAYHEAAHDLATAAIAKATP